jgi:hypothetical protein
MLNIQSPLSGIRSPFGRRGGFSPGGFSPAVLFANNEPGVWYDPSDLATLFQDTAGTTPVTTPGQTVALMLDKSGNGFHATQATTSRRPTYQVDAGGRGYLSFDGVDDWMVTLTITPGIDKVQVFAGVRKLRDNASGLFVEMSTTIASNNGAINLQAPGLSDVAEYRVNSKGTTQRSAAASAQPDIAVVTATSDISGDLVTLRIDGTQVAQSTEDQGTGNFLAYPMYIGRRGGTTLTFKGDIYSLITRFGANLEVAQIESTEAYVAGKTGVDL